MVFCVFDSFMFRETGLMKDKLHENKLDVRTYRIPAAVQWNWCRDSKRGLIAWYHAISPLLLLLFYGEKHACFVLLRAGHGCLILDIPRAGSSMRMT